MVARILTVLLLLELGAGASTFGEEAGKARPMVITSQSLVVHNQDDRAVFDGSVVLTQGAFRLSADQMTVFFAEPIASAEDTAAVVAGKKISIVTAVGNVAIRNGDQSAKGKKAVFYERESKVVLTGDPEVWQEGYRVSGSKLTLFLKDDRSVVEGGSRVVITDTKALNRRASEDGLH